jgi:gluconate 5-dehydrogenase
MTTMQDIFGLGGKVALVTGASSGLGVEIARALAMAGADVALTARRGERLEQVAADLRSLGVQALGFAGDATERPQIERIAGAVEERLGPVDVLVNSAGVAPTGRAETYTEEKWRAALDVNLNAVFAFCQLVGKRMIERRRGGRIINVTSIFGALANSVYRSVGYVASKAGTENLTRQLAVEWAPHAITVNAIAPAWFPTEMTAGGLAKPGNRERMERFTPLARLGEPQEVWTSVLFLASPYSSYVTGSVVYVDGGWTAW